jgi:LacI family transcriptional regulator
MGIQLTNDQKLAKRPSINDVAREAGVSKSAVSKVLRNSYGVSPGMREKVESAIERLGYRPRMGARTMRGRSNVIGVEIPQMGNDFFTQVICGIQERLEGTGFTVMIAPASTDQHCEEALNSLVDHQVDGIIAISPDVTPEFLNGIAAFLPLVMLGRQDTSLSYDVIVGDDEVGTEAVMSHLFELGHTNITHLTVVPAYDRPDARQSHPRRNETYRRLMESKGLEPRLAITGPTVENAYEAGILALSAAPRPTAIFCGNDTLAVGALKALADLGISRSEVTVVGYDDIEIASHPLFALTTVNQFGAQMGRKAVELLLERIEGQRSTSTSVKITPALRRRTSHKISG